MSDYPDPDEEYELMYAEELELMREVEEHAEGNIIRKKSVPAKRSLDFTSSPVIQSTTNNVINVNSHRELENISQETNNVTTTDIEDIPLTPSLQPLEDALAEKPSNKRTAEDLFGDINDIDFDNLELPSKRQKTDEEVDLELINKILEARKLQQMLTEPSKLQTGAQSSYNIKENISFDIPRWNFIPLTNLNGERMYVKLESEESWDKTLESTVGQPFLQSSYLSTWEEARKILEAKQEQQIAKEAATQSTQEVTTEIHDSSLWVDKYKPHSYLDLLSEEPVNRSLLHWLHLWDKIVFKKEVKMKEPQQRNSFSKRTGQFELKNKWKGKKESEPEIDQDGRPHHKVALLCGPPGVGKTTLAHLLARLAGYRPVELNASDERSTEAFRTALQNATLMRSVIDAEKRPNCLILDEIDGAPLPTVELLVKWCTATAESGNKKGKTQPLKRPVIAICNDLYTNSLRPLRPVSLIIHVGGVSIQRLSGRLSLVARLEGLMLHSGVCAALATRVDGDARAAIHLLSFIKAKKNKQLRIEDVENAAIGTKDCNKSMMQALQAVYTVNDKAPDSIMKTIQAAGEYDRLVDGIFENYLSARVDARLKIANETLSWLLWHDVVHSWTLRTQNYSMYGTLPLCIANCHRLLASRSSQRLKFPTQAQEMYRKKIELSSIVTSVWQGSTARVLLSQRALQMDLIPLLPYLLCPTLRSANIQLCSENERKALRTCAGAMCDYGLQYVQQRTQDGLYAFVLEPQIHKLAFFGNEERVRPTPAIRQAIAGEQQLEIIRRNEEMANRVSGNVKPSQSSKKNTVPAIKETSKEAKETRLPNHLQRLKPKDVQKSIPQVHKDFFGRIVPISEVQKRDAVPDLISSSRVFYQYREGFNNAVRRNVRTEDLL